jgi:hypothetical protein
MEPFCVDDYEALVSIIKSSSVDYRLLIYAPVLC